MTVVTVVTEVTVVTVVTIVTKYFFTKKTFFYNNKKSKALIERWLTTKPNKLCENPTNSERSW